MDLKKISDNIKYKWTKRLQSIFIRYQSIFLKCSQTMNGQFLKFQIKLKKDNKDTVESKLNSLVYLKFILTFVYII